MALRVLKFGGSFIGDLNAIKQEKRFDRISVLIQAEKAAGNQVVVVISAMEGETRYLKQLSDELAPDGSARESDVILSAGEQITAGLLAKVLNSSRFGLKACSLLAWQIPIVTDDTHGCANISHIGTEKLKTYLNEGYVVVVPGFQGVTKTHDMTTLGFDGSDTTAVALAGALQADYCRLYKDVAGLYTANPKRVPRAQQVKEISYHQMYVLTSLGARILHPMAVERAEQDNLAIHICSQSMQEHPDTIIQQDVANYPIAGITYYQHAPSDFYISVVGEKLNEQTQQKMIDALAQEKIIATPVKTAFDKHAITVNINWLEQLDTSLQTLHSLFGLDNNKHVMNFDRTGNDPGLIT